MRRMVGAQRRAVALLGDRISTAVQAINDKQMATPPASAAEFHHVAQTRFCGPDDMMARTAVWKRLCNCCPPSTCREAER